MFPTRLRDRPARSWGCRWSRASSSNAISWPSGGPRATNFGKNALNRGVLVGLCSAGDLLELADAVEASLAMDSAWCGDALFVNRRLDAVTLLAAVAGRTERVLLGPACMGSFALRNPLVFAYEWASLNVISNGRTRMVACAEGGAGPLREAETAAMGIGPDDRRKHMVENIHVLRHLWNRDNEPFEGKFIRFSTLRWSRSRWGTLARSGLRPTPSGCREGRRISGGSESR